MGPLLFRAEDDSARRVNSLLTVVLQWGRSCSERKTRYPVQRLEQMRRASMGPLLFRAEDCSPLGHVGQAVSASMGPLLFRAEDMAMAAPASSAARLQWGRSCSERKTGRETIDRLTRLCASMGPLLFRAEDVHTFAPSSRASLQLQWGRSCSERKTPRWYEVRFTLGASMGPLLFRAEDGTETHSFLHVCRGFNGAALVQSGRLTQFSHTTNPSPQLQWGRSCSERKTPNLTQNAGRM